MPSIDPIRLRELREQKRLSRRELAGKAKVSERQLARIETGEDRSKIRNHTLRQLVRALDVSPEVLAGEEPIPDEVGDHSRSVVQPHILRALRERRGMSRARLAEECGLEESELARIESSSKTVVPNAAEALATALGVDTATLSRSGYPEGEETSAPVRLGTKMSPQLRLAYDLIAYRYGPTPAQVIELAPLLFALAAEGCLARRRRNLEEAWTLLDGLYKLGRKANELYFVAYQSDFEAGAGLEAESIDGADLLGDKVRDGEAHWFFEDDLNGVTPFADHLCAVAESLDVDGTVDFHPTKLDAMVGSNTIWGAEPYQVCNDVLTEITGGSRHARWALAFGDARISTIPRELMAVDASEARIAWLEARLSEAGRQRGEKLDAALESIAAPFDPDEVPGAPDAAAPRGEAR